MLLGLMLLACSGSLTEVPAEAASSPRAATAEPGDTGGDDTGEPSALPEWTLLIFVNGDNDLEAPALADFNEMERVGSTPEINVLVQLDRSERYARADGDWSGARRYLVEADSDSESITSPVLEDLGATDSGSVQTVLDFVAWGASRWPAQRYALILWDHGDGWSLDDNGDVASTKGISYDDGAGTGISVAAGDLTELVEGAAAVFGQPIDLLGLDACNMSQWEVAWSVGTAANTMVASEDYEALTGWPYDDIFVDLMAAPSMDAPALGAQIALRFHEVPDSTLSVLDLAAIPSLSTHLDAVADAMIAGGLAAETLRAAADGAQGYDGEFSREHDLIDLLERIEAVSVDPAVDAAAVAATEAAQSAVLTNYNRGGAVKKSHGISIFSPSAPAMPPLYARAAWSAESRWDDLIRAAVEDGKQ